jgi:hypothetical protein
VFVCAFNCEVSLIPQTELGVFSRTRSIRSLKEFRVSAQDRMTGPKRGSGLMNITARRVIGK